jgi:uncharacterized protein YcgI (DUF1989 family)
MPKPSESVNHTIKFIPIEPGARVADRHEGGHYLGIIPAKGRKVAAYLVYAIHDGKTGPTKKKAKS